MAARTLKPRHQDEVRAKFYVYEILDNYLTFKYLASKVDKYYSKELQDIFNTMNTNKLYEVGYGNG